MASIKSIFDQHAGHLKIEMPLMKRIHNFTVGFANRNEDHIAFFGGNLLGVHPVRFRTSDRNQWYDDIMAFDDVEVKNQIVELPDIDPEWVRGTDVMNLSCLWLVHVIYNSKRLTNEQKREGMIDTLMMLHYKFITSLMSHFFKYKADKSVALATYAALSRKFDLKVYGSWGALLRARCENIIDKNSIHYNTIVKFDNDKAIQNMITDIQGRLKNIVKKLRAVFETVRTQDAKIRSSKMTGYDMNGDQIIKDMSRNFTPYRRYLHEVATDPQRFIKPELTQVIESAMHTMPPSGLHDSLMYISTHYGKDSINIEEMLDEILLHAFDYLSSEKSSFQRTNDLVTLITNIRFIYTTSRGTDPSLLKIRDMVETLVSKSIKSKNPSVIASVRTGVMLYVVLITLTMSKYV